MTADSLQMPLAFPTRPSRRQQPLADEVANFKEFGKRTIVTSTAYGISSGETRKVPTFVNEFWTARQRQAHSLQEVSYRACFKPQLPAFFIHRLTQPRDIVYDPFMGRGTSLLEAALNNRTPYGCDINPLSAVLVRPRFTPPSIQDLATRLKQIDFTAAENLPEDLLVFFHEETLRQICALKKYLLTRRQSGALDSLDEWICMVSLNRLTGHSPGFFSVYTLPPNQAVSCESQAKINKQREQTPPRRDVPAIILKKSRGLLRDCDSLTRQTLKGSELLAKLITGDCANTPEIAENSVSLVVTSPPFLNVVDYATDNWLRCWFLGIDAKSVKFTVPKKLEHWQESMIEAFHELNRTLRPGGHIAFEVGEVHGGKTRLEEAVLPAGEKAGLKPLMVIINDQEFTKTANCWGVDNNAKGTNTNRIVVFQKPH